MACFNLLFSHLHKIIMQEYNIILMSHHFFHGNFSIESLQTVDEDNNNDSNDNETMILIIRVGMAFVT